ncbi:MAG: hypothetical protein ACK5X3_17905 [Pseudomonadota bacterium]|jgi:hypothetical protein
MVSVRRYLSCPVRPYEEGMALYSDRLGKWFHDIGDVWEYYEDQIGEDEDIDLEWAEAKQSPQGICEMARLFLGRPVYLPWAEIAEFDLPDGVDDISEILPPSHEIRVKLAELNKLIEETKLVVCYEESSYRPDPETLDFKCAIA